MSRSIRPLTVTLRAFGWRSSLILAGIVAFLVFGLPRLLSPLPSSAKVQRLVRDLRVRQVRDPLMQRVREAPPDSASLLTVEMARAIAGVDGKTLTVLAVRRSWIGPPFSRRFAYFAEVRESDAVAPGYYRIANVLATEVSRSRFLVRLF